MANGIDGWGSCKSDAIKGVGFTTAEVLMEHVFHRWKLEMERVTKIRRENQGIALRNDAQIKTWLARKAEMMKQVQANMEERFVQDGDGRGSLGRGKKESAPQSARASSTSPLTVRARAAGDAYGSPTPMWKSPPKGSRKQGDSLRLPPLQAATGSRGGGKRRRGGKGGEGEKGERGKEEEGEMRKREGPGRRDRAATIAARRLAVAAVLRRVRGRWPPAPAQDRVRHSAAGIVAPLTVAGNTYGVSELARTSRAEPSASAASGCRRRADPREQQARRRARAARCRSARAEAPPHSAR